MKSVSLGLYPYDLQYIMARARDLEPVMAPNIPNNYYLALGITNSCNYDCPFCYYHVKGAQGGKRQLSIGTAQKIFGSMPSLAGVIFGLEGEPLLHDNFLDILKLAEHATREITLITNGSLLTEKLCDEMSLFPIGRIILSIDGSDAESYGRFRKNGRFERFKRNAAMIARRFSCQLHATVFRENLGSLHRLPELARNLGIGRVSLQQVRLRPGSSMNEIHSASIGEIAEWLGRFLENAGKHDIAIELDRNFGGSGFASAIGQIANPDSVVAITPIEAGHCDHADRLACIMSDGSLFPCAGDFEPVPLQEYSFDAVFNHPYLQALRSLHKAGRRIEPCRICMNDLLPCY